MLAFLVNLAEVGFTTIYEKPDKDRQRLRLMSMSLRTSQLRLASSWASRYSTRRQTKLSALRFLSSAQSRFQQHSEASAQSTPEDFDLVIVGGGPAGLALAGALASSPVVKASLKIALVEAGDLERIRNWSQPEGTYSNRVSSITNASKEFLEDIGAWEHVEVSRTRPVEDMQVWDGISDARISFSATDILPTAEDENGNEVQPQLSQMTENLNLQRALLRLLSNHQHVKLMDKVKVEAIVRDGQEAGEWPIVETSDGRRLRARLLVGADGFNSPVKKFAGIDTYGWAYDTHAVVATLFHAPVYPNAPITAYQRFLPTGPIAFLPLSPTTSSLVWSTKPALASALKSLDPEILRRMINAAFRLPELSIRYLHNLILQSTSDPSAPPITPAQIAEDIKWREESHGISPYSSYSSSYDDLGGSGSVGGYGGEADLPPLVSSIQHGSIAGFPLRMSHADTYLGDSVLNPRTALIGDAAHTIHPLAGQGLNMGLADVKSLAETIEKAVSIGADIGSYTALAPYPREQYFENHKILSATDKLHKIYSTSNPALVWARSVGLEVVNELDSLKTVLMLSAGSGKIDKVSNPPSFEGARDFAADGVDAIGKAVQAGTATMRDLGDQGNRLLGGILKNLSAR